MRMDTEDKQRQTNWHVLAIGRASERQRRDAIGLRHRRLGLHVFEPEPLGRQRLVELRLGRRSYLRADGDDLVLRLLRAHVHERTGLGEEDDCAG